jgi:hypothetical protein
MPASISKSPGSATSQVGSLFLSSLLSFLFSHRSTLYFVRIYSVYTSYCLSLSLISTLLLLTPLPPVLPPFQIIINKQRDFPSPTTLTFHQLPQLFSQTPMPSQIPESHMRIPSWMLCHRAITRHHVEAHIPVPCSRSPLLCSISELSPP